MGLMKLRSSSESDIASRVYILLQQQAWQSRSCCSVGLCHSFHARVDVSVRVRLTSNQPYWYHFNRLSSPESEFSEIPRVILRACGHCFSTGETLTVPIFHQRAESRSELQESAPAIKRKADFKFVTQDFAFWLRPAKGKCFCP